MNIVKKEQLDTRKTMLEKNSGKFIDRCCQYFEMTDPQLVDGRWWAFPKGGVMALPVPTAEYCAKNPVLRHDQDYNSAILNAIAHGSFWACNYYIPMSDYSSYSDCSNYRKCNEFKKTIFVETSIEDLKINADIWQSKDGIPGVFEVSGQTYCVVTGMVFATRFQTEISNTLGLALLEADLSLKRLID